VKTEGGSRRTLPGRKDPGASVGCYIGQGFPASRDVAGRGAGQRFHLAVPLARTAAYKPGWIRDPSRRPLALCHAFDSRIALRQGSLT
jgi:hypothetical protein